MLFNSLHFVAFFPIATGLYFATPGRHRWAVLLALSYYFYASWRVEYVFLLAGSTLVDYGAALGMGRSRTALRRKLFLALSLSTNLGVLFFFKYFTFVSETIHAVLSPLGLSPGVASFHPLLPVGISFYTFQTLAYALEVYWGRQEPERHLGRFALYVSFFPQLVAGPIERPGRLLPQLRTVHRFVGRRVVSGLTRMGWGFFQKLVIADRLALAVNDIYNNPQGQTTGTILLGTYLFAFQLYADFAGYTDIARGTARVMGYELMVNFRRPFFATSISDFWRRWHISMTTWFRDYLFKPLGGARKGRVRALWNIVAVFFLSGLWHGAAWTYVVSGLLFAAFFLVGHVTRDRRNAAWQKVERWAAAVDPRLGPTVGRLRPWLARILTFHLVCIAFLFFRANTIGDALYFVRTLGGRVGEPVPAPSLALEPYQLALALAAILTLLAVNIMERDRDLDEKLLLQPRWIRWGTLYGVSLATLMFGHFGAQPFIYFQF